MTADIDMNGNDVTRLLDVPPTDNSAASKKYVDDKFSAASGMTRAQADGRYVRKTKIAWRVDGHVRRRELRRLQLVETR
jgi:hypothetical protein